MILIVGCERKDNQIDESFNPDNTIVTEAVTQTPEPSPTKETPSPTKEPEQEEFFGGKTQEEVMKLAEEYAQALGKKKYEKVYKDFSETMKEQMTEDNLKTVWDSLVLLSGDYKKIEEEQTKTTIVQDFAVTDIVLRYKENGFLIRLSFNKDFEIEGIRLFPYTFEDETTPIPSPILDPREHEIKIGEKEIDGILTLPDGVERPPVVILIQGSGQSDLDETIGAAQNKPFRDIALGLADFGIAVIRYNKRYYQYPELADETLTIEDEVLLDAADAIKLAAEDIRLNKDQIYVLGHSLGGMLAPKIAQENEKVAGIISLAGTPRHLEELIYDQNMALLKSTTTLSQEELAKLQEELLTMKQQVKQVTKETLSEPIFGVSGYYWQSLNEIDQAEIAKQLNIPMLFLQGSEDFQVYPETDFELWKEILEGKEKVSFKLYEGLNHIFMKSNGKKDVTEYDIAGAVEQQVIEDIANWILTGKFSED